MSAPVQRTRKRSLFRSFGRSRNASAAVEFALIAPMFFALLFAIIESSIMFFASQLLETGTQDSARMLFTHQAQDSSWSQSDFNTDLCNRVKILFDCSQLYTDVRSFSAGSPITVLYPVNGSGAFVNNFVYQPADGGSSSVVVVRAFYQWPLFVTQLGYNIADIMRGTSNSKKLLAATAAFRVEPGS